MRWEITLNEISAWMKQKNTSGFSKNGHANVVMQRSPAREYKLNSQGIVGNNHARDIHILSALPFPSRICSIKAGTILSELNKHSTIE
jgi:hypothetical protein